MKKHRGYIILFAVVVLCVGAILLSLHVTAEYPALGEPVSHAVNQLDGFQLTMEKPSWSPFNGYTIRWTVTADSKEIYSLTEHGSELGHIERFVNGQWHILEHSHDNPSFNNMKLSLGGENRTLQGSIVQKHANYGNRLEAGSYRFVLEMEAGDKTFHHLAAEFDIK